MTIQGITALTIDERLDARSNAAAMIVKAAGERPDRAAYDHYTASKYPRWVAALVTAAMLVVFIAAAAPSLFRLFTAGRDYFLVGIADTTQAAIAGGATFLLAEFLVIVSTLVMRIYFTSWGRFIMAIPAGFGVFMALVGNWVIAQPHDLFGLLETFAPPVAVLFMSLVGEKLIFASMEQRHANEQAYQQAVKDWKTAAATPEKHSQWTQFYANALRESLAAKNRRYKAGREALPGLSMDDWRALVGRELAADNWFVMESGQPALVAASQAALPPVTDEQPAAETRPFGSIPPITDGIASMPAVPSSNGHTASANGQSVTF